MVRGFTKCVFGVVCLANDVATCVTHILEYAQSTRSSRGAMLRTGFFASIPNGFHGLVTGKDARKAHR